MYRLLFSERYRAEQTAIDEDTARLDKELQGLYEILKQSPDLGHHIRGTDLYARRHRIFLGLAPVTVYWQIDEADAAVTLVSIRLVDPLLM